MTRFMASEKRSQARRLLTLKADIKRWAETKHAPSQKGILRIDETSARRDFEKNFDLEQYRYGPITLRWETIGGPYNRFANPYPPEHPANFTREKMLLVFEDVYLTIEETRITDSFENFCATRPLGFDCDQYIGCMHGDMLFCERILNVARRLQQDEEVTDDDDSTDRTSFSRSNLRLLRQTISTPTGSELDLDLDLEDRKKLQELTSKKGPATFLSVEAALARQSFTLIERHCRIPPACRQPNVDYKEWYFRPNDAKAFLVVADINEELVPFKMEHLPLLERILALLRLTLTRENVRLLASITNMSTLETLDHMIEKEELFCSSLLETFRTLVFFLDIPSDLKDIVFTYLTAKELKQLFTKEPQLRRKGRKAKKR